MSAAATIPIVTGVAIAVGAFIIEELVRDVYHRIAFRQRLWADARLLLRTFRKWNPPARITELKNESDELSLSPIWDYGFETIADVYANSIHLAPDIFAKAVHLYSASGRFAEIRRSYNAAVFEAIKCCCHVEETEALEAWIAVLNSHLLDLQAQKTEICEQADALLRCLEGRYSFSIRIAELETGDKSVERSMAQDD